ncbi:ABC transporter permease [Sphingomonas sanxanigenens]|uniref:ABC-2 type transporter transmembrane domain-containing protein n=2 Tax=Alphaproteobacteria TaxID=28211 RepID=W0A984_9SPHN|nr:ABC transporter permease [Sphingomonas sanxanigenens]AHE53646.1 hypothetical protein NX02_09630 [Sphingomonas sanxanigenens DSM 19645 = NX02]
MNAAFLVSARRERAFLQGSFWDLALISWLPLALLAAIAIQISSGVMRDLPVAVVDEDGGGIARELVRRLEVAPGLRVAARPVSMLEAEHVVRSNAAYAVILIPQGLERAVLRGETGQVSVFYNASYSTPSGSILREVSAVVQGQARVLATQQTAAIIGPARVRAAPIAVQSRILYNPQASYELQLVALIHPALLHLLFMIAVVSALGRELRDGTIGTWLAGSRREAIAAIAGKLVPYLAVFMLWAALATTYLVGLRGWPVAGSVVMLMAGYLAMYLAYAGMAVLIVGLTLSMGQALSMTALYAGASFAFAGAIFPIESSSAFARLWSALLPYTTFARLVAEQWMIGAPVAMSAKLLAILCGFLAFGLCIGLPRLLAASSNPAVWGRR